MGVRAQAVVAGDEELHHEATVGGRGLARLGRIVHPAARERLLQQQAHADALAAVREVRPAAGEHREAVLGVERQERRSGRARAVAGALMGEHEADAAPDDLLERREPGHRHA